MFERTATDLNR